MSILAWGALGVAGLYFALLLALALRAYFGIDRLAALPLPSRSQWPRLSLVTPARDEAASLEAAVRSRLESDYPDLEIVLVDDRSRDATGDIADQLAAHDPRVQAIHVAALPAGWLGKVHALARGAEAASGEWLLFTDADVHFSPDALRRAVGYCEDRRLDFLAAFPDLWSGGLWIDVAISSLLRSLSLGTRRRAIEDPTSRASAGSGVFNLVRRSVLARTAGFESLKLEVIDDACLAQMVKRSGARCSIVQACGLVGLHYYRSLGEMVRGGEKNAFALVGRFRLVPLLLASAVLLALAWAPLLAIAAGGRYAIAGALLLGLDWAGALVLAAWLRRPLLPALLTPIGSSIGVYIALRSGALALRHGGIAWRDTFYSLTDLRAGARFKLF